MGAYRKCNPVRDEEFRRSWMLKQVYCISCGVKGVGELLQHLEAHHIVKFRRSDEATNLVPLCGHCHGAAEGLSMVLPDGTRVPKLNMGNILWLKKTLKNQEYDEDRLMVLYGKSLPDTERPDKWFENRTAQNRKNFHWPPRTEEGGE